MGSLACRGRGARRAGPVWRQPVLWFPGNDLGRVLRWGAGYSGEDPFSVLLSVDEADAVLVDRWTILLDAHESACGEDSEADAEPPKVPACPGRGRGALWEAVCPHPGHAPVSLRVRFPGWAAESRVMGAGLAGSWEPLGVDRGQGRHVLAPDRADE